MKTLQNNFTTPEQSKRLMELGVPADSADMLWDGCVYPTDGWEFDDFPTYSDKPFSYYQSLYRQEDMVHILPCWSVGRLIEIYLLCHAYNYKYEFLAEEKPIDTIVSAIEYAIQEQDFDFSKLEE